jgi:hypothetical protein
MARHDCLLCITPPGCLPRAQMASVCQCGQPLGLHTYDRPHGCAVSGCPGYQAVPVVVPVPAQDVRQLSLLHEEASHAHCAPQ